MVEMDLERHAEFSRVCWLLGALMVATVARPIAAGGEAVAVVEPAPVVDEAQPGPGAANPQAPVSRAAGIPVSRNAEGPATYSGPTLRLADARPVLLHLDEGNVDILGQQ